MAGRGGGSKSSSLYAVLGVASDCSDAELRSAYRKLAMVGGLGPDSVIAPCLLGVSSSPVRLPCFAQRSDSAALLTGELMACVGGQKWHPDKCAGAGSSAGSADAAKARFQKIQGAYAGNQSASYDMR